jgi:putative ABC transport system ATP-binding protein
LQGLDLDVHRGECIALLGRSGSGKSTLLNLISGIDLPSGGEIHIDGADLTRMNERERTLFRRRQIGFIYQFYNLIPTLTVEENLCLPMELNNRDRRAARRRVAHLLEQVDLAERRTTYPDQLSGGEQQRIAIARALAHEPLLVLADEPTGNLDAETGQRVLQILDALVRTGHKTLILVTHSRQVTEIADRVLTLEKGRIKEGAAEVAW